MKNLIGKVARAIKEYDMIPTGCTVGVAVSGENDSVALLYLLHQLQKSMQFNLYPIHAKIAEYDTSPIRILCERLNLPYTELDVKLNYDKFSKKECYICSRFIKGYITEHLRKKNITRVAFGHHADDVASTFFINLIQHNKLGAFLPVLTNTKSGVDTIRPLIYLRKKELENLISKHNLPLIEYECPYANNNYRMKLEKNIQEIEEILNCKNLPEKIYKSLQSPQKSEFWNKNLSGEKL